MVRSVIMFMILLSVLSSDCSALLLATVVSADACCCMLATAAQNAYLQYGLVSRLGAKICPAATCVRANES